MVSFAKYLFRALHMLSVATLAGGTFYEFLNGSSGGKNRALFFGISGAIAIISGTYNLITARASKTMSSPGYYNNLGYFKLFVSLVLTPLPDRVLAALNVPIATETMLLVRTIVTVFLIVISASLRFHRNKIELAVTSRAECSANVLPGWRNFINMAGTTNSNKTPKMATLSQSEQDLQQWITRICRNQDSISVTDTISKLRQFGVEALKSAIENCRSHDSMPVRLSNRVYSSLYTAIVKCNHANDANGAALYERLVQEHHRYCKDVVLPSLERPRGSFLEELDTRWKNQQLFVEWMRRCFKCLDSASNYVQTYSKPCTVAVGFIMFKRVVYRPLHEQITKSMLDYITKYRLGESVSGSLFKMLVDLFLVMSVCEEPKMFVNVADLLQLARQMDRSATREAYALNIEAPIIKQAASYYKAKSREWLSQLSTLDYLRKVGEAFNTEHNFVSTYLHVSTLQKMEHLLIHELMAAHTAELTQPSLFADVLARNNPSEIAHLSSLSSKLPEMLRAFAEAFRKHTLACGRVITDAKRSNAASHKPSAYDPEYIGALLQLRMAQTHIVATFMKRQPHFVGALRDALRATLAARPSDEFDHAAMLASYIDHILRGKRGAESLSAQQIEEVCNDVAELFEYLPEKDTFGEAYRSLLAQRLLSSKTQSFDLERHFVSLLKVRCGSAFTTKLEGMINDIAADSHLSQGFVSAFGRLSLEKEAAGPLPEQFSVSLLTAGFWPTIIDLSSCALPSAMSVCVQHYTAYFCRSAEEHKRLVWLHSEGTATLDAALDRGKFRMQVSTLQAAVLLLFNHSTGMTCAAIAAKLNIPSDVLKKVIHPLIFAKEKHILKLQDRKSKGTQIHDTDFVVLNTDFKHKKKVLAWPTIFLESSSHKERVGPQRVYAIDAAIVRIMKARKTMQHSDLLGEVLAHLRFFQPSAKAVKERINDLIEREYLQRDAEDVGKYHYLA